MRVPNERGGERHGRDGGVGSTRAFCRYACLMSSVVDVVGSTPRMS